MFLIIFSRSNIFILFFLFVGFQNLISFFCCFLFIFEGEGLIIPSFFFIFSFFLFIFAVKCSFLLLKIPSNFAEVFQAILLFLLISFQFILLFVFLFHSSFTFKSFLFLNTVNFEQITNQFFFSLYLLLALFMVS